jgi:hypothetical protein
MKVHAMKGEYINRLPKRLSPLKNVRMLLANRAHTFASRPACCTLGNASCTSAERSGGRLPLNPSKRLPRLAERQVRASVRPAPGAHPA